MFKGVNPAVFLLALLLGDPVEEAERRATRWISVGVCLVLLLLGAVFGQMLGIWRCHRQAIREGCPGWVCDPGTGATRFRFGPEGG